MVANNEASKEDMTSTDANNAEKGTRRTFVPESPPMNRATNCSRDDAFRKVDDAAAPSPLAGS
jgi:hypothetical protein